MSQQHKLLLAHTITSFFMLQKLTDILESHNRLYTLLKCLIVYFFLAFLSVIVMIIVDKVSSAIFGNFSIINTHWKSDNFFKSIGLINGILLFSLFGPILEELAFRLYLSPKKLNFILSLGLLLFFVSGPIYFTDYGLIYFIRIVVSISMVISLEFYLKQSIISYIYEEKRDVIFIVSSIIFSIIHIKNFAPLQYNILFIYPFFVLPQLFLGLILGWLRIQHGILWAILFHILVNAITTWPRAFSML